MGDDRWRSFLTGLEWTLLRSSSMGQRIKGTNVQVWPVYPGGGVAYVVYYLVTGDEIRLLSLTKRETPLSGHFFDLED